MRLGFALWPVSMGFVIDRMALWQVFLCVLLFLPVSVILPMLHTHILFHHICHCIVNCLFLTGRQAGRQAGRCTCAVTHMHADMHLTNHQWQFSFLPSVVKLELLNWVWYCTAVWFPQNLCVYIMTDYLKWLIVAVNR